MKASYWQRGEALDYVNRTEKKIENEDVVVLGNRIGIAGDDIPPGARGTLHVTGVFSFKKSSEAEIAMGTEVYFTETGITAEAGSVKAGYAAEDSPSKKDTVVVKINA